MTVESFLHYLRYERNYSEKTIVSYGIDLREFQGYLNEVDGELKLENVDSDIVRGWIVKLMEGGMSGASVNRKLSALRTFYKYLLKKKMIMVNPMSIVKGPKRNKPLPTFVREGDMDRLLDSGFFDDSFEGIRDELIMAVFYETGVRLSELISLNDADIDLFSNVMKVTGKRNKQRLIPFGEKLKNAIRSYVECRNVAVGCSCEAFFVRKDGKRLYRMMVYRLVKQNLSKVVALKKRSPHVLRHSFATAMLNNNAELEAVKELLGHESVTTTEIYTHTTFEELKKVYKQAHPRA